ncbi:LysR family transcriptional regulator [Streptomyces sp. NPDC087525]|uniref:LysR family transcriptional regulator n=1 Tax=Streptomyces sp. NPDC087525 TaxID=3365793 RepID=UPI003813E0F4
MDLRTLRYFVTVAEELHFGRAAARLHMTQPPLSRAIQRLETDLGCALLVRSPTGVALTTAGAVLRDEARTLLDRAERVRARVTAAAGAATLTVGTLADSAEQAGTRLAAAYRQRHPAVRVRIRETDLTDPTAGLRAGLVDVALTRAPFDDTGITVRVLRSDPVGVVLRTDDPLAGRESLRRDELRDRRWFRLPEGTDPAWRAFWSGPPAAARGDGPVVRTAQECLQSILWDGTVGLAPLGHTFPEGLTSVPLADMPSSDLVIAWNSAGTSPLIRSFVRIAAAVYGPATT